MTENKVSTVDEYISTLSPERQVILSKLRSVIKQAAPDAEEKISYSMPYYHFHGRLAYFMAFKNHYGFYVMKHVVIAFREKIKKWEKGAATLQFKYDEPLPEALITEIVKYVAKHNLEAAEMKKIMKTKK
jgi:uncharacterized protein YdhG (YjbR/CyaY superfamily)